MPERLIYLPLGGAGEIGMNAYVYGYGKPGKERLIVVDLGVTFGDDSQPSIDVIMPDPVFIAERRESLLGIVLTHAHEDHIGAVPHLWRRLGAPPIYCTPFTASATSTASARNGSCDQSHAAPATARVKGVRAAA